MKSNVATLRTVPNFRNVALPEFISLRMEKYYRERVQNTWAGGHIMRGRVPDTGALHLSSNDYLTLAQHPKILARWPTASATRATAC